VLTNKLPVTAWKDMLKDPDRVRQFVDEGKAEVRYAAVIDEGGHLTRRDLALYADRQAWRVPTARARLRDGTTWDPAPLLADREPLTGKPDNSDD
jgi:hypothetical protein